ncbi:MAG TPA: DUF58 domain-containing protein [Myxococcota bacterium]|nr:DUF58 domain-containing protein [Myxococcota bacterium]
MAFQGNGIFCTVNELLDEGRKSKSFSLHLRKKTKSSRAGGKRSTIRGRGMEFFESRPYVFQDEMRSIDWKVSARLDALHTKVFIEERSRPVFLAIDQRSSMFFGSVNCFKSVLAARIAARLATAAINGGDYFGGAIFDQAQEYICPISGERVNLARFFGLVANASQPRAKNSDDSLSWSIMLERITNRVHAGSAVFLLSDFFELGPGQRERLYRLRKKSDVFALAIFDPLEEKLPALGTVAMAFGRDEITFDSDNAILQKKYQLRFKERQDQLGSLFSSQDIPLLWFSTADDLDIAMRRIFLGRW